MTSVLMWKTENKMHRRETFISYIVHIIFRQSDMDTLKFHITQRSKGTDTSDLLFLKSDKREYSFWEIFNQFNTIIY